MRKIALIFGSLISGIALAVTTTASWVLFHTEEIPEELK